ncbi:MAG TPA: hypothetical protein VGE99_12905 [Candidatus Dormibacteraeota bacterium]
MQRGGERLAGGAVVAVLLAATTCVESMSWKAVLLTMRRPAVEARTA